MVSKLTRPAPLGSRELLARILDQPNLVAAVQGLPAPVLGKLINHVGLEDAGEIVALASIEQIRRIFDDDLWRSPQPGQDETFDGARFARWLEIMLEAGEVFAASRLAELPEDFVTLALQKQVLVINIEEMALAMSNRQSDGDTLLEKALESCLCEEIGEYRIIARRHEGWDAIWGILLALDRDHHEFFSRVLDRCCYAAAEYIEENGGLYDVLTSEEMLESDAAAEREDRRAEEGYLSPSSAASFLALARTTELPTIVESRQRDPITKAYFRGLRRPSGAGVTRSASAANGDAPTSVSEGGRLMELLREAEVLPASRVAGLLAAPVGMGEGQPEEAFRQAVRQLAASAPAEHARRMEELAFVANVLHAGCSIAGRSFRPAEAAQTAVAVCNLGLAYLTEEKCKRLDVALAEGAEKLFRIGWRILLEQVAMPAADKLVAMLTQGRGPKPAAGAERAAAAMRSAVAAGKPWTARSKLAVLHELVEPPIATALLSLIDECPHLAGAARPAAGSSAFDTTTDFDFISTRAQLVLVRAFLGHR